MKIIDVHAHAFPDDVARKAMPALEAGANAKAHHDGTLAGLLHSMRQAGIEASVLQPVSTKPSQVQSINDWVASVAGDHIIPFGSMHPEFEDFRAELKRMKRLGMLGIKFHPEYQVFYPDDERLFPLYEAIVANELVVLFHAGIDIEIPTLHGTPERFARVLDAFPEMKLILAHMGSYKLWDEVERYLLGRNVYFDTSYVFDDMELPRFVGMVLEHGVNRVLFGTDSPWTKQKREVEITMSSGLSNRDLEAIFSQNVLRLLG